MTVYKKFLVYFFLELYRQAWAKLFKTKYANKILYDNDNSQVLIGHKITQTWYCSFFE